MDFKGKALQSTRHEVWLTLFAVFWGSVNNSLDIQLFSSITKLWFSIFSLKHEAFMLGTSKTKHEGEGFDLFITTAPIPDLNDKINVFGHVTRGEDIVQVRLPSPFSYQLLHRTPCSDAFDISLPPVSCSI